MRRAAWEGVRVMVRGHTPFVPHLAHVIDEEAQEAGLSYSWVRWMEYCLEWLRTCDALLSYGCSRGADIERALAEELGLPIYTNVYDLPLVRRDTPTEPSINPPTPDLSVMIVRLPHACETPQSQTAGSAAMDLPAAIAPALEKSIEPEEVAMIPTGLCIAIPSGYAGLVLPRSGLSIDQRMTLANTPGLIDSDFRGEIKLCLMNEGKETFRYVRGDRLAQLLVVPVARVAWEEVGKLPETARGTGGWGSTGIS